MITFNEYDKIIKGDKEMKDSAENKFYIWLSGKIPASQVSDYFLIYQEINNICLRKLMVGRLFDIFDAVLLNKIKNNIINEACSNKTKIEKALQDLVKAKHWYDAAAATLKDLLDKRDALRQKKLLDAIAQSGRSYEEIMQYLHSKSEEA